MKKSLFVVSAFAFFISVAFTLNSVFPHQVFSASANIGLGGSEPELTPTGIGSTGPIISPTIAPDEIDPYVHITYPVNGGRVNKNSTVTITADANDNVSVVDVKFYVNGVLTCTDATSPYACAWAVPKKPNVTYALNAQAIDPSGNIGSHTIYVVSQ